MHAKCEEWDLQVSFDKWTKFREIAYTKGILYVYPKKKSWSAEEFLSGLSVVCMLYVRKLIALVGVENHYDNLAKKDGSGLDMFA